MIVMYSKNGCPRCDVLEEKLAGYNITFQKNTDIEEMKRIGISMTPMLCVDGEMMDYSAAIKWIKEQGE